MDSTWKQGKFFFEGSVVGYFEGQLPSKPGNYRYMPYRGCGHLRLVEALKSLGSQSCYYVTEVGKHHFTVLSMADHQLRVS